jgi:hypothetical protein
MLSYIFNFVSYRSNIIQNVLEPQTRQIPSTALAKLLYSKMNKFVDLKTQHITYCFNKFCRNLFSTWWFITFQLFNSNLNLLTAKQLGSGTKCSAVCISVCLTSLTPM